MDGSEVGPRSTLPDIHGLGPTRLDPALTQQ